MYSYKKPSNKAINPLQICSPFNIPDSPTYLSLEKINTITNIQILKQFEYDYDLFIEKKFQILVLLDSIDLIFEIRDAIIMRINSLKRQKMIRQKRYEQFGFIMQQTC
jgi:hypothetical protein